MATSQSRPVQWFRIDEFGIRRASRLIVRGTLILEEVPWATLPLDATREDIRAQIPEPRLNQLHIRSPFAQEDITVAKFKSNRLRQGTRASGNGDTVVYGVFPNVAAFSSSCLPNLHPHWNGISMQLRAVDEIPAGTELTISHDLDFIFEPCQIRRTRLWGTFGINCCCQICLGIQFPIPESDGRRAAVKPIVDGEFGQQGQFPTENTIKWALELLQQEGLYIGQDSLEFDLYQANNNNAVLWGQALTHLIKARDLARTNVGGHDRRVADLNSRVVDLAHRIGQYRNQRVNI